MQSVFICSKSTKEIPEQNVKFVNFGQMSHIVPVFPLLTLNKEMLARKKPFVLLKLKTEVRNP